MKLLNFLLVLYLSGILTQNPSFTTRRQVRPPISNVEVKNIGSAGHAGFTYVNLREQKQKFCVNKNFVHIHNFCARIGDQLILLIKGGNAHKLTLMLLKSVTEGLKHNQNC